jgi:hypothetical protein
MSPLETGALIVVLVVVLVLAATRWLDAHGEDQ